jgi:uncharacterized phiE125 gp8 family phage protein
MMLIEQTTVPSAALAVAEFKDHLMLGTGFADDGSQDAILENYLRSAIAAIEARTGKVLIEKQYTWSLTAWRAPSHQALPLAPISGIQELRVVDRLQVTTVIDAANYTLERDDHRPVLWAAGARLPTIGMGGTAEVDFTAGFGPAWGDVPADLMQAVFLLGAHFYENRSASGSASVMPFSVNTLIERYRNVRILGGGVR